MSREVLRGLGRTQAGAHAPRASSPHVEEHWRDTASPGQRGRACNHARERPGRGGLGEEAGRDPHPRAGRIGARAASPSRIARSRLTHAHLVAVIDVEAVALRAACLEDRLPVRASADVDDGWEKEAFARSSSDRDTCSSRCADRTRTTQAVRRRRSPLRV